MSKQMTILMLVLLFATACSIPEPTTAPLVVPTKAIDFPTREPSPTPMQVPTQLSPTAPPPTPSPTTQPTATPEPVAVNPLEIYEPAMRSAFVDDLTAVGSLSRYRVEVRVDPETSSLAGKESVTYVNNDPVSLDRVYFRLFPNLPSYGGDLQVANLLINGQPATSSLEVRDTALRVPLPEPLPAGGEVEITFDFRASVPQEPGEGYGQFVYTQTVMALANFFPLIPAYDEENCARFPDALGPDGQRNCDQGWNIEYAVHYGDAVFSDSALFEVLVTTPTGWTAVGSGSTVSEKTETDGQVTWHMVTGPMRDFNLVLSPRYQRLSENVEDIVVNSYFLPEDAEGGSRALRWVTESLRLFNQRFGPYPFAEFDVAATPTVAGGIEYPGLIVMPIRNYDQESGFFQLATIHEVAHQWWYSLVGNDQQDEPWLDEALAQYSTALYYEFNENWTAAGEEMFGPWYDKVRGTDLDGAIDLPVIMYEESLYGPLVYGKGPLFFDALRQELGDELFFAVLQAYLEAYRYQIASGPELLALIDEIVGRDLTALYGEWLGTRP